MSALFPVSELLTFVAFAATMLAMLGKAARRRQPIRLEHRAARPTPAGRRARSAARSEGDFPSTGIC